MNDLCVIGGGIGGLALAALAQRKGLKTALCESHTKLGGCAGYFNRGPFTFDCGATALMGLNPGEPIHDLFNRIDLELESVKSANYRICLPEDELFITSDSVLWEASMKQMFPDQAEAAARFWRIQEAIGNTMFQAASKIPRLPLNSASDVYHNLKILGIRGSLIATTSFMTVMHLLRILGLHQNQKFKAIVAMLLQDTAQAGPESVPLANAAACLQAYRLGLSRPRYGMKSLAEGLGEAFTRCGGDLRMATIVDSVSPLAEQKGYLVKTRRGHEIKTQQVAFNLPVNLAAKILSEPVKFNRLDARSRAQWSAFTGYAAIDASVFAESKALFHHVLQDIQKPIHDGNNVLISVSPEGNVGYGPVDVRTITMSTHVKPDDWDGLSTDTYQAKKQEYSRRMMSALNRAFPDVNEAIRHIEFASPRSFARYTRRTLGRVGGPPVSRRTANLMAVDPGVLGNGRWLVGDSVFPGQGTMAVVMCAMRVLERMTGESWYSDGGASQTDKKLKESLTHVTA